MPGSCRAYSEVGGITEAIMANVWAARGGKALHMEMNTRVLQGILRGVWVRQGQTCIP
jgi:hypothetical protein